MHTRIIPLLTLTDDRTAMADLTDVLAPGGPRTIREGLPPETFEHVAEFLELSHLRTAALIGIAPRTLGRRMEEGQFKPDESDRLARLARIVRLALEAFGGSRSAARSWLKAPHALLDDEPPLEHLDTDVGARAVEDILNAIRYGFAA